jgi:hypothetical protein
MACALVVLDQAGNSNRIDDLAKEGAKREDQFCLLVERAHRQDVRQLRSTYAYLISLPPEDIHSVLNQLVLRELPSTELKAHTDSAPKLCDEPGHYGDKNVGLPEPDPEVPKRPPQLDRLVKESQQGAVVGASQLKKALKRVAAQETAPARELPDVQPSGASSPTVTSPTVPLLPPQTTVPTTPTTPTIPTHTTTVPIPPVPPVCLEKPLPPFCVKLP